MTILPGHFAIRCSKNHVKVTIMRNKQVSKSEFKAKALEIFRQVETSGEAMVVTDRGKPKLEVRPYRNQERDPLAVLRGPVVRYPDPTAPLDVGWEAAE
jgi:hypothetical protein